MKQLLGGQLRRAGYGDAPRLVSNFHFLNGVHCFRRRSLGSAQVSTRNLGGARRDG